MILLIGMAAAALLVVISLLVHYEMLRLISVVVPRLTFLRPRDRIVAVVGALFWPTPSRCGCSRWDILCCR
jgi:hypothetical protein